MGGHDGRPVLVRLSMNHPFATQAALLEGFLARRAEIVANIESVLNCQKAPVEYQHDYARLSQRFNACLYVAGLREQATLAQQLDHAHWDSGFKPRAMPGNELVHPVEQMVRAFNLWRLTRWPGAKGRLRFAHTLFNLYVLRCLALLCMRVWDEDASGASARLAQLQSMLDALWSGTPADQPRLVRNVRWLYPVAMSPTTDSLQPYFPVAERIAELPAGDRVEVSKAWVVTGAAHLRSQLYQLATQRGVPLDDRPLVLITRMSNALDVALLMQGLVTLLQAYADCVQRGDATGRADLAFAICQGISPDPELFVNRLDLLLPYSMIEELFVATNAEGHSEYTAMGHRNLALFQEYASLIARLAQPLHEDCRKHAPTIGGWSPYGVLYGFASNLLELMAFKTLQLDADMRFSMEDIFTQGDAAKLAWVVNWRNLPHIRPEVAKQFDFPRQFAADSHVRVEQALQARNAGAARPQAGHLFVMTEDAPSDAQLTQVPELPRQYVVSSDPHLVAAQIAEAKDNDDLLHCRMEGEFLVSYTTAEGWCALTKDLLTDVLGAGRDAKVAVPREPAAVLKLMCPDLVVLPAR
jgi:hypothetical protein